MQCSDDPSATNFGYDGPGKDHNSGYRLRVQTFADRMRAERGAHVVTLSAKARSAIMLAGHGGDAVTWLSEAERHLAHVVGVCDRAGARGPALHRRASGRGGLRQELDAVAGTRRCGAWTRRSANDPPAGWTSTFPHVLNGTSGQAGLDVPGPVGHQPVRRRVPRGAGGVARRPVPTWERTRASTCSASASPASIASVTGSGPGVRRSAISWRGWTDARCAVRSSRSRRSVAGATSWRCRRITASRRFPSSWPAEHADAGRIEAAQIVERVEALLAPALGAGAHVAKLDGRDGNLYFANGVYERLRASPRLLDDVVRAIATAPGIARVFRSEELKGARHDADPWRRAAALSYVEGRSGDLVLAPQSRLGRLRPRRRAHGTASADDQRVPILFMGYGIKAGRYDQPVTPADIAPTLAAICGSHAAASGGPGAGRRAQVKRKPPVPFFATRAVGRAAHSTGTRRDLRRRRGDGRPAARGAGRRQHHARLQAPRRAVSPGDCRRRKARRLRRQRGAETGAADGRRGGGVGLAGPRARAGPLQTIAQELSYLLAWPPQSNARRSPSRLKKRR